MSTDVTEAGAPEGSPQEGEAGMATRSRRSLLKALGATAVGALAGGVFGPTEALAHGSFHEESNTFDPAIHGNNTNGGAGVEGTSATGPGVFGSSSSHNGVWGQSDSGSGVNGNSTSATGVHGESDTGTGVFGRSENGPGVAGESISNSGVFGNSDGGSGVVGRSHGGPGVDGSSDLGPGVLGRSAKSFGAVGVRGLIENDQDEDARGVWGSTPLGIGVFGSVAAGAGVRGESVDGTGVNGFSPGDIGVFGESETGTGVIAYSAGTALRVLGKAEFSTAGSGVIPLGQDTVFVSNDAVTNESHITATLMGDPGPVISGFPAVAHWVERRPGLGFVLHLTRRVGQGTPFTYLIVEPG